MAASALAFIACIIAGIILIVKAPDGKLRLVGLAEILFSAIFTVPFLTVWPTFCATASSISGEYDGVLDGARNKLILHRDGTFEQDVDDQMGYAIVNRGTWTLDQGGLQSLGFDHIVLGFDLAGTKPVPYISSFGGAYVRLIDGRLVFNDDEDEGLNRVR